MTTFLVSDTRGCCVLVPGCEQLWDSRTRITVGVDTDSKELELESCSF